MPGFYKPAGVTKNALATPINGTLEPFLFGTVGVEENGMSLSVLSALARLGLDPWAEAIRLAALRKEDAVAAIARHLALADGSGVAARLAALLPVRAPVQALPAGGRSGQVHGMLRRNVWMVVALWLALAAIYLTLFHQ
jgi:hypothetical protein